MLSGGGGKPGYRRARRGAGWDERCAVLFEDLRKPARVMIARAYGRALSPEEIEDVYANAWTSTLAALRGRERSMTDEDLRSYLLTAVAGHASKEMRRRSRKPTGPLEDAHAQVLADAHQPLPEERAVGSETASVARDVLASLPPRRRAVMLLRYGWGLSPTEICSLVADLSPRAYRKEVTRGIEQLIARLGEVESGEWCRTREPILRDYVAGVADEDTRRQAVQHMAHCRQCGELVNRLAGHLHELGSGVVLGAVALGVAGPNVPLLERLGGIFERGREAAAGVAERGEVASELAGRIAVSGAGRGAGAAGAGVAAKLTGLGAAGKAALACLGAGAAASACIAAGVVPGIGGGAEERPPAVLERPGPAVATAPGKLVPSISPDVVVANLSAGSGAGPGEGRGPGEAEAEGSKTGDGDGRAGPAGGSGSDPAPAPAAPAGEQEFGLPPSSTASGSPTPTAATAATAGSGSGSSASAGDAVREFGP